MIWLLAFATLFTPMRDRMEPNVLLVGMYSSCPDNDDGSFGERIFPYIVKGKTLFALHLGPNTELALFAGPELEPHESHDSPANLLYPAYRIGDLHTLRGDRNWSIGSLHVWLSAVKAGGSDPACESFFVKLTQTSVKFASGSLPALPSLMADVDPSIAQCARPRCGRMYSIACPSTLQRAVRRIAR